MLLLISKEDVAKLNPNWTDAQVTAFYKESFQFLHDKVEQEAVEWVGWLSAQWLANNINKEASNG